MRRVPALIAISDVKARQRVGLSFVCWLERLGDFEIDGLQIRERHLGARQLLDATRTARRHFEGTLFVNGRLDVALVSEADGLHLPARGLPAAAARRVLDPGQLLSAAVHDEDELTRAVSAEVDLVLVSPIFPTASKPGTTARGLAALERAAATGVAVAALGGVNASNLPAIARAGACSAAGIGVFHDLSAMARIAKLRPLLERNRARTGP